jgi:hypothetical protein
MPLDPGNWIGWTVLLGLGEKGQNSQCIVIRIPQPPAQNRAQLCFWSAGDGGQFGKSVSKKQSSGVR